MRAALDQVGLLGKERVAPLELSVGEQQRVGIARAIVSKPPLLVADEPTGNLDATLAAEVMGLFRRFNEVGVTVVVATHDLHLVQRVGTARDRAGRRPRVQAAMGSERGGYARASDRGATATRWCPPRVTSARHGFATVLTVAVMGLAMALPLALQLLVRNVRAATGDFSEAVGLSVYFKPEISRAEGATAARRARASAPASPVPR